MSGVTIELWKRATFWTRYTFNRYVRRTTALGPPVLIVGCGHSGTSLLTSILGQHPRIFAIPHESNFAFVDRPHSLIRGFDAMALSARKARWAEKTPSHINRIDRLLELCPNARIVLMIRDGRDVACSIQDRTGNIEQGIRRWVDDNKQGQQFWNHPSVHVLRYEHLITDFDATLSALMTFIDENVDTAMREFYLRPVYGNGTTHKPPSAFGANHRDYRNWQIRQPLFDGRGKWQRMSPDEKRLVKLHASEMLIEYGYATGADW